MQYSFNLKWRERNIRLDYFFVFIKERKIMNKLFIMIILLFFVLCGTVSSLSYEADHIISNWSQATSPYGDNNTGSWQKSGIYVWNGGNYASAFVSDITTDENFAYSGSMTNNGDNDMMGLVWGWTNAQNNYRLAFGGGGGSEYNGLAVFKEVDDTRTTLYSSSTTWTSGHTYNYTISREGNNLNVLLKDGTTVILDQSFTDNSLMSGQVGFYTHSQSTYYWNIEVESYIPEPTTFALVAIVLCSIYFLKKNQ